jgi:hypothetical protein
LVCNAVQIMVFWYVLLWFPGMLHCVVWWMSASILEEPVSLNVLHSRWRQQVPLKVRALVSDHRATHPKIR